MKIDKKDLNKHWFKASTETFEALVKAGYNRILEADIVPEWPHFLLQQNDFWSGNAEGLSDFKQAYHHNGEFFTRNENGEIRGLWITDVPLEEQAYLDACEIAKYIPTNEDLDWFKYEKRNWLSNYTDGRFNSWAIPQGHKITWQEFIETFGEDEHRERWLKPRKTIVMSNVQAGKSNIQKLYDADAPGKGVPYSENELTYGETQKPPFPALEDLENFEIAMVEFPKWWPITDIQLGLGWCKNKEVYGRVCKEFYLDLKALHENSKDLTVTWKLKEKDIYAELKELYGITWKLTKEHPYAELVMKYHTETQAGNIVRVWEPKQYLNDWKEKPIFDFMLFSGMNYELRFYEIDWQKVPSGTKVICSTFGTGDLNAIFICYNVFTKTRIKFIVAREKDGKARNMQHCRLPKGTEIKPEWLKEIKR